MPALTWQIESGGPMPAACKPPYLGPCYDAQWDYYARERRLGPMYAPRERNVRACGRRDGFSKVRTSSRPQRSNKTNPSDAAPAWWEDEVEPAPAPPVFRTQGSQDAIQSTPSSKKLINRGKPPPPSANDDEDGPGWWENPQERSMEAYAPEELEDWQVARLEQAYALGRKKIKMLDLSDEINVDRSYILHWMKQFALKPESERAPIVAARLAELQGSSRQPGSRHLTPESQQQSQAAAGQEATAVKPTSSSKPTGFIPFYTRKEMGLTDARNKRLPADALRTLEAIYERTPFPSNEVVKGMWDLHRINRDTALTWFKSRRESDGILSSEQKRPSRQSSDEFEDEDIEHGGHASAADLTSRDLRKAIGPLGLDSNNLLVRLAQPSSPQNEPERQQGSQRNRSGPGAAGDGAAEAEQQRQPPRLVSISPRQLAQMQSSLPSPKKHKGAKRMEAMGITEAQVHAGWWWGTSNTLPSTRPRAPTRYGLARGDPAWRVRHDPSCPCCCPILSDVIGGCSGQARSMRSHTSCCRLCQEKKKTTLVITCVTLA
ncbi:uncharacterized protein HaLaN_14920 [Haematococcus lacustris]|uniref:Homeobox domain-containing protein n=1 Tax=Haematococcus lacustris TaxID=44745 RepID=A0A699Z988_HAELA|nr:uncharacterized protein HaLaN_14920 [Haematococcus lacustris]